MYFNTTIKISYNARIVTVDAHNITHLSAFNKLNNRSWTARWLKVINYEIPSK